MNDFDFKKYIDRWLSQTEHLKEVSDVGMTQEEVSKELGVTRSTISKIERDAINTLRMRLKYRHNISGMDDVL